MVEINPNFLPNASPLPAIALNQVEFDRREKLRLEIAAAKCKHKDYRWTGQHNHPD
jgi:hypothetical protein